MKQPVEVEILGQRLRVTSDDGEEHIRRVAAFVDERMRQLAAGSGTPSMVHVALVAALNIASEYWKLQHEQEYICESVNRLSQRVQARIER